MKYSELLNELQTYAEENYANFQRKLIATKQKIIGVRTPLLRKIAKKYQKNIEEVFAFPNEYYEVTFIKLTMVAALPYEQFVPYLENCISLMDNWGMCDSFKTKCLRNRKEEYLPVLERIFAHGGEYYERYVLVTLLGEYVEEKYLPLIEEYIRRADTSFYYIHMAIAWLTAEVLVNYYDFGVKLLQKNILDSKTHNKAIQKAVESYRITKERKEYLRSMKIKNKG